MRNLNKLSQEIHENAVNHGFWEDKPTIEHCLMLVVTEIAEMVEADRKGNSINIAQERRPDGRNTLHDNFRQVVENAGDFNTTFEALIKNTVEDEMADVAIRLLDLAGSLGMDFDKMAEMRYHRSFDRFTFTENAFALTKGLCRETISIFKRIHFGLFYVEQWAKSRDIMLQWHIRQKMRYNAARPNKHGKKY